VLDYVDDQERRAERSTIALTLPLHPNVYAELRYAHPMTADEWEQMMAVLSAMKPGVVNG
jgi:hypothetical protein